VDRETRSSILPVRTRYRLSSVAERGPPKPDVDCSIQSAGANVFFPLAGTQRATVVLRYEFAPFVRDVRITRRSWKADVRGMPGSSSLPTSKDDAGVDASEAESVRNRMLYRHAPGLTGDEVDAFRGRVAIFKIEGGRRDLVA
jgi:hypothetical protein